MMSEKKGSEMPPPDGTPKENRRVKYTKMVIRQSLLELLETRPIEKITVTDICTRSDINRGTFYVYYADPYDLLTHIEQELFEKIQLALKRFTRPKSRFLIREMLAVIAEERDLCKSLFSEFGDKAFLKKILDQSHDQSIANWRASAPTIPPARLELIYAFFASGSLGVIEQWLQSGMNESPDEITELIDALNNDGLRAVIR